MKMEQEQEQEQKQQDQKQQDQNHIRQSLINYWKRMFQMNCFMILLRKLRTKCQIRIGF